MATDKKVGTAFKNADMIYGGDPEKMAEAGQYIARLRLALRIVYADAATAKTEGEKALDPSMAGYWRPLVKML